MNNPQTAGPTIAEVRARRVWDDLSAAALLKSQQLGHAIDQKDLLARVEHELGEMANEWTLERAALQAQIEDLQRRVPPKPRPTGTTEDWAARIAGQGPPSPDSVSVWRSEALRRLAAIGITAGDVTIVRLADALLQSSE